ncbi:MAG: heavy metal translocating P-type ATPase, partial [Opitutales bacterium]
NTPFQQRDFADLAAWQGEREAAARAAGQPLAEGTLALSGVSCVGCVWLVEKVFEEQAGAVEIVVTVQRGEAKLRWRPGLFSIEDTAGRLQQFGYLLGRAVEGQAGRRHDEASTLARKLGLCGLFALNAMLFSLPRYLGMEEGAPLAGLFELATLGFATASLAVGGLFFVWRAAQSLRRGLLHIDLPIALGIVAAYAGSFAGWWLQRPELMYFDFVAVFIFLMLVGRWTQEVTLRRNQARLARQGLGPPREVLALLPDGSEIPLPREQLGPGQRMRLPPGAFVPVAARNGETTASVSLEWITGESEPRAVAPGEPLPAGTTNAGNTPIEVIASETWAESLLARLLETRTYDTRDPAMEAILRHYIAVVLVIATIGGVAWWLTAGFVPALQVFISILVVSCPCALGVAAPLASELGLSKMQNAGVFVKSAGLWRRLGEITTLVFDKTGTLTLENPRLINTEVLKDLTNEARDALRELVRDSLHPISRALRATVEAASSRFANTSDKRL